MSYSPEWMDGWIDGWMDGWLVGCWDVGMPPVEAHSCLMKGGGCGHS